MVHDIYKLFGEGGNFTFNKNAHVQNAQGPFEGAGELQTIPYHQLNPAATLFLEQYNQNGRIIMTAIHNKIFKIPDIILQINSAA